MNPSRAIIAGVLAATAVVVFPVLFHGEDEYDDLVLIEDSAPTQFGTEVAVREVSARVPLPAPSAYDDVADLNRAGKAGASGADASQFLEQVLLTGENPALENLLGDAKFGMTREEVAENAKRLQELEAASGGALEVEYNDPVDSSLSGVAMDVPNVGAAFALLSSSIGAPTQGAAPNTHIFAGPGGGSSSSSSGGSGGGVRGILTNAGRLGRLRVNQYQALDDLVDPSRPTFGFERIPFLGAHRADLNREFGERLIDGGDPKAPTVMTFLPPTDYSEAPVAVTFEMDADNRVARVEVELPGDLRPGAREAALALLTAKFGPASTQANPDGSSSHEFARDPNSASLVAVEPSADEEQAFGIPGTLRLIMTR